MNRGLHLTLIALCVVSLGVGSVFAFTPRVSPIPDVIIGDFTPPSGSTPGDVITPGGSLEASQGEAADVFQFPNAFNIFDLVRDEPEGVAGYTSDEALTYAFWATPIEPAYTATDRIRINADDISSSGYTTVTVGTDGQLSFKDLAVSSDELNEAIQTAPSTPLIYPFGPNNHPTYTGPFDGLVTETLIDVNAMRLRVTNTQANSATQDFMVYTVDDGPDAVSGAAILVDEGAYDLSGWLYIGSAAAAGALGPDFPGDTTVAGAALTDDDGDSSVSDLQISIGGVTGSSYVWWQSPSGLVPFVDNGTYRLDWTMTENTAFTGSVTLRCRMGYGEQGGLGNAIFAFGTALAPIAGSNVYTHMFDEFEVATANSTAVGAGAAENSMMLFFESVDLEGAVGTIGSGAVELDSVEWQLLDRDILTGMGSQLADVADFSDTAVINPSVVGGPLATVTNPPTVDQSSSAEAVITCNAANTLTSPPVQVYGTTIGLTLNGVGLIPVAPDGWPTERRFFRAEYGIAHGAYTTTAPLPNMNLLFQTFDAGNIAQVTSEVNVQAIRNTIIGGTSPAFDATTFSAYLNIPADQALGSGETIGENIGAGLRAIDGGDTVGGALRLNALSIDSFPESILP